MASTQGQKAWGTTVSFDGITLGELVSFAGARSRNMIDVFSCDSDDEAVERLTSGLDEGAWTLGFIYQHGANKNYDVCNDKFLKGIKGTLLITGPTPSGASAPSLSVQAIITSVGVPGFGSARDVKTFEITVTTSGKVTYTDSTGSSATASVSATPSASASSSPSASPSASASA